MKPLTTKNSNTIYMRDDCNNLPGAAYQYEDGTHAIETCWELSEEELEIVKKTKKIYVQQQGETLPPMALAVNSVFEGNDGNETEPN